MSVDMSSVKTAREHLLSVEKFLNQIVVGHEEKTRALLLALVAKEHVVMISPPGTAKSYLVHSLSKLLNAKFYKYLLTKFTDYSELFGPVNLKALAEGRFERNWTAIVSAEIVFLDEIFKANSAILNSLLSMMQERIIYDPVSGQPQSVALWTLVGASNEVPSEEELQALFDRFALRVFSDYLQDDALILKAIEARWASDHSNIQPLASMEDVKTLHHFAIRLITAKVKQLGEPLYKIYHVNAVGLVKSLRSKGVIVSDRTIIEKLPKIYASYLALYGITIDNAMNAIFDILPYLASDRSQLKDIRKAIEESLGEVAELAGRLEEAKNLVRAGDLKGALEKLEEILQYDVSRLQSKPWLKPRAEAVIRTAREYYSRIKAQLELIQKLGEEL